MCRRSTPARADQSEAALSLLFPAFQAWPRALVPLAHHQATGVSAEQAESRWSSLRHWSAFEHDAAGGARTLSWSSCCTTACREVASADIRRFWPLEAPQECVRCFRSRTERKRVAFAAFPPGLSALRRSKISSGVNKPATARALSRTLEGEDVMTCCAAAICAVRHSVSSPLPVLGCSALPRHCHACLGAQSCDRARVASACAGNNPQGCSSPRPLCSGVTNQVSAETRLPDYPIPMPSLCSRPRCSG